MILHNLRICNSDLKKKNAVSFAYLVYISSMKCQADGVVVCLLFTGFILSKEKI